MVMFIRTNRAEGVTRPEFAQRESEYCSGEQLEAGGK